MTRRVAAGMALGALLAVGVIGANGLPDIGEIMWQSRDLANLTTDNCALTYDRERHEFMCGGVAGGGGAAQDALLVTLALGRETIVADARVAVTSIVRCGCAGKGATACNLGGRWVRGVHVASTGAGQFVVGHGQAMGDEQVVCLIDVS